MTQLPAVHAIESLISMTMALTLHMKIGGMEYKSTLAACAQQVTVLDAQTILAVLLFRFVAPATVGTAQNVQSWMNADGVKLCIVGNADIPNALSTFVRVLLVVTAFRLSVESAANHGVPLTKMVTVFVAFTALQIAATIVPRWLE